MGAATYFAQQMDPTLTWQTLEWIRELWPGPLYIKGIMTTEDALAAQQLKAEGIVVSNHGGRQLDGTFSPMLVLPDIRKAVGPNFNVLLDSGFRRGTDGKSSGVRRKCSITGTSTIIRSGCRRRSAGVSHPRVVDR